VCTVALFLSAKFANFYGANIDEHPAEDVVLGKQPPVPADIKRRMRIIMNTVENVPIELSLFWAAFISVLTQSLGGGGAQEALALNVLFPIYTASRIAFVAAYARGLQPARTIVFALATFCALAAAGVLLASAAKAYAL